MAKNGVHTLRRLLSYTVSSCNTCFMGVGVAGSAKRNSESFIRWIEGWRRWEVIYVECFRFVYSGVSMKHLLTILDTYLTLVTLLFATKPRCPFLSLITISLSLPYWNAQCHVRAVELRKYCRCPILQLPRLQPRGYQRHKRHDY
jgi:hypothetical protein